MSAEAITTETGSNFHCGLLDHELHATAGRSAELHDGRLWNVRRSLVVTFDDFFIAASLERSRRAHLNPNGHLSHRAKHAYLARCQQDVKMIL
jgi:hypothetical protein